MVQYGYSPSKREVIKPYTKPSKSLLITWFVGLLFLALGMGIVNLSVAAFIISFGAGVVLFVFGPYLIYTARSMAAS